MSKSRSFRQQMKRQRRRQRILEVFVITLILGTLAFTFFMKDNTSFGGKNPSSKPSSFLSMTTP